jgi:uncharacterized protein YjiS (DUF1127 family)
MGLIQSEKCAAESSGAAARPFSWLIDLLRAWHRAAADRNDLAGLSDRDLKDLGLCRHDVDDGAAFRDRFR